jgi:hypothetical protein
MWSLVILILNVRGGGGEVLHKITVPRTNTPIMVFSATYYPKLRSAITYC